MNPETGSFARCVKHPSQVFTGFCSTCLVERLSNVDSVESAKNASHGVRNETVDTSESVSVTQRKRDGVRVRKTLLSLFELDDLNDVEKMGHTGLNGRVGTYGPSDASGYSCFKGEKPDSLGGGSSKGNIISSWLHSKNSVKGLIWSRSSSKKIQMQERCLKTGVGTSYLENKHHSHASCDWTHDTNKASWEKSRHSWDGSVMSKALACSFLCFEEQQDGSAKLERSLPDEASSFDIQSSSGENDLNKVDHRLFAHNSIPLECSFEGIPKELHHEKIAQGIDASDVCRKKSNGWSRVWDWSITSPFRDFAKRNGHVLERSLSESWRDNHKDDNVKSFHSEFEVHHNGTPLSSAHFNRSLNRDIVSVNDNRHGKKFDQQKLRELKISRSHSVRYSSPRNLDSGLLRFYLTPLRASRRNVAKHKRTSHSLARSFLGL